MGFQDDSPQKVNKSGYILLLGKSIWGYVTVSPYIKLDGFYKYSWPFISTYPHQTTDLSVQYDRTVPYTILPKSAVRELVDSHYC